MAKNTFTANWAGSRHDEIAQRAYEIWERAGRPDGQAAQHWFQAEGELAVGTATALTVSRPKPRAARRGESASTRAMAAAR